MDDTVTEATIHDVLVMLDPEHRDRDLGPWDVRAALLLIHKTQQERTQLEITAREIQQKYTEAVAVLLRREEQARLLIQEYIARFNDGQKISFPDTGSAHLRTNPAAIEVDSVPEPTMRAIAAEFGCMKETPDVTKLKKVLLTRLEETGEAPPEGFRVREARQSVVITL